MTTLEQKRAAKTFAKNWAGKGYEKGESQRFWIELLGEVFGVQNPAQYIRFEDQVKLDKATGFIDGYIDATKVMIEQKSIGKSLRDGIRQSDGSILTPFQQAKRYAAELPYSARPRWIVTSNFESFFIYDMEKPHGEPAVIELKDFEKEYYRLSFLVEGNKAHIIREEQISFEAGKLVGQIYDSLAREYQDISNLESQKSLNELCVRLVFCLYAEDSGLFGAKNAFHDYLARFHDEPFQMRKSLIELFQMLDTPEENRDPYDSPELLAFPYVNGGLFSNKDLEIPRFTPEICQMLLDQASDEFDWSQISPTIFGAVFESTLNPETRHSGGMHYTSIENIHKVIDPLFLSGLKEELVEIKKLSQPKTKRDKARAFQDKLSKIVLFDPACGSGNFLTESYISLRQLENDAIAAATGGQIGLDTDDVIRVNINQFYGIEINDFAVTVAHTALWIAEHQMFEKTQEILHMNMDFLPLKSQTNIVRGNALRTDWASVVPVEKLSYIVGNPPFLGARVMDKIQKADLMKVFEGYKGAGNLDFVSGWYLKAAQLIQGTKIQVALVSTNSITQGEQASLLWKIMVEDFGIKINMAYQTFKWASEATDKAAVHCVIIGFATFDRAEKIIFDTAEQRKVVQKINGYLVEADNVFIENRSKPLCDVSEMGIGNKPIDGGFYLFEKEEMEEFIAREPNSKPFFRKWLGAQEFLRNRPRYCLWLGDAEPQQLRAMPAVLDRIRKVRDYRLNSPSQGTRKIAEKPTRFHVENMPSTEYLLIPSTSSENRKYIPIGFENKETIASNATLIVPNATLFEFGVLTSNVHMAWMRTVAGRLEMRYRYSAKIVYNNFPWPTVTPAQKQAIERTAQGILDARALYPNSTLADLYDDLTMPPGLRRAHQLNDRAVMDAYGMRGFTESQAVERLFEMYEDLTRR